MWRILTTAVVATVLTGATSFVWWGLPLQRLRDDVDSLFQKGTATQTFCAEFANRETLVSERRR